MCIARRRLASSMKGLFSSSVNNFHSAPLGKNEKDYNNKKTRRIKKLRLITSVVV